MSSSRAAATTTYTFQGCRLPPEGARAASAKIFFTVSSGTGSGRNARIAFRVAIASLTSINALTRAPPLSPAWGAKIGRRGIGILKPPGTDNDEDFLQDNSKRRIVR